MSESVDYIIIGAGSAGCVLANRLSADPDKRVLLIEAGGADTGRDVHMPGGYFNLFRTPMDWTYWTEPQEHVLDRRLYVPRGKVLGGCSSTNAMLYVRGNHQDYDHWAELGNAGWSYAEVLPYFIKSEHYEAYDQVDEGYHGQSGELNVALSPYRSVYSDAFVESAVQVGIPKNPDYNGVSQTGVYHAHFTVKNGKRHSGADAFLTPILSRPNLEVLTHAQVLRILLENDRAVGVELKIQDGDPCERRASREVVLAAGAINSPQVLMLSGIGDPEQLQVHGIACRKALPGVGRNLQDHLFYPICARAKRQQGMNHLRQPIWGIPALLRYMLLSSGPLSAPPLDSIAFLNIDGSGTEPNFEFHFSPGRFAEEYGTDLYDSNREVDAIDGCTLLPTLLQPKSRGSIELRSSNPLDAPIIQSNFLSDPRDVEQLLLGGKLAIKILDQSPMQEHMAELDFSHIRHSDEALILHMKKVLETVYHPVGTCAMGSGNLAVVDDQLRVHGIEGLRVIDASIMPTITNGNTNAPTYMIAEKGADMILNANASTTSTS